MRTYYIYKIQNIINGKIYIGKTCDIGARIRQHIANIGKKDSELHLAMAESGIKNFVWQIIDTCIAREDAAVLEAKYIKEFESSIPNGYNKSLSSGGCPVTKPIICLTHNGDYIKRYDYLSQTVDDGYDLSCVRACLKTRTRQTKGVIFMYEDEYMKNGTQKYHKQKSTSRKAIVQCDLSGNKIAEFESVTEASETLGIIRSRISSNLILKDKTASGYIFVYKENFPIKDMSIYKTEKKGRKVVQLDKETGELINVFDRMSDAGKWLGKSNKNIHKVINNPLKSAYGYRWFDYDVYVKSIG